MFKKLKGIYVDVARRFTETLNSGVKIAMTDEPTVLPKLPKTTRADKVAALPTLRKKAAARSKSATKTPAKKARKTPVKK